jgi:hypothetical protein
MSPQSAETEVPAGSELNAPFWAVISSAGIVAQGITYTQAHSLVSERADNSNAKLTVVTMTAAERFLPPK